MKKYLFMGVLLLGTLLARGQKEIPELRYEGKAPAGLVGNGKFLIRTAPLEFTGMRGIELEGKFSLPDGKCRDSSAWNSTFFPGGVEYVTTVDKGTCKILYGVSTQTGYTVCIETPAGFPVKLEQRGAYFLRLSEKKHDGKTVVFYSGKKGKLPASYEAYREELHAPYTKKLVIDTPDSMLNKAVVFSQYLLDLCYNGKFMLCELFRWQDIWARDLGSGLLPGGLTSGRPEMARKSLEYDLNRYAGMNPQDCKNSNDPSQGGTSSGIGWTARSIWKYYLYSGDRAILEKDAAVIRPWVKHWIERDYDEDGLIIDVTEFMDHMIMMLSTNGVSTLAANAMYAGLLYHSALIENELGNIADAERLHALYQRTVNAINSTYWNEQAGYFNNLTLWGTVSERSSQASQAMLLKINATDPVRARKTLDYLKQHNWNAYGSITIVPRMNHVPLKNDQNMKVWPWWNLWEAEARFKNNDKAGGYRLLHLAARTIRDEKYPGLLEETLDLEGKTYGGNAFPTGAGNLLEVTIKDLFGIEPVRAGWETVKVIPSVPDTWDTYSGDIPTPRGFIRITCKARQLSIDVNDPAIQTVQTTAGATVTGAAKQVYTAPPLLPVTYRKPVRKTVPAIEKGKTALFYDENFHTTRACLPLATVNVEQLGELEIARCRKVVIPDGRLPLYTPSGKNIRKVIERFVAQGGSVILYGATTNAKCDEDGAGILGEQGGLIDWYQYLPAKQRVYAATGKTTVSAAGNRLTYTASIYLDPDFRGKDLQLEIGQLAGLDSTYINGTLVGNYLDMTPLMKQEYPTRTPYPHSHAFKRVSRVYTVRPGEAAYHAFRFGENNVLTVQISRDALLEGLTEKNKPNISIPADGYQWQALDEDLPGLGVSVPKRKGVNYWGNEQFFNSWSTQNGLFGFSIQGKGVTFCNTGRFAGLTDPTLEVQTAYTDFALFAPWIFEPLAYTTTREHLLYPMEEERYPCVARIVNTDTGGGFIVITPALVNRPAGKELLGKLGVEFTDKTN